MRLIYGCLWALTPLLDKCESSVCEFMTELMGGGSGGVLLGGVGGGHTVPRGGGRGGGMSLLV